MAVLPLYLLTFAAVTRLLPVAHGKYSFAVATYNIWNVMFHWEVRRLYIADMIKKVNPDILALQEVRSDRNGTRNQMQDLQSVLPDYLYSTYHKVAEVEKPVEIKVPDGWEVEGIAILSKYPIMLSRAIKLNLGQGPDTNERIFVHAEININGNDVNIGIVHLSYDKQQQCANAADIVQYLSEMAKGRTILLGDFNVYTDFKWAVEGIMNGEFSPQGECANEVGHGPQFVDAWSILHAYDEGFTFSNMPYPGLISRPDRILVSKNGFTISSSSIYGHGEDFEKRHSGDSYWARLHTVLRMFKQSATGPDFGYSCLHDCGPDASCRCGVCIRGGNKNTCTLPLCYECDSAHYYNYILFTFCLTLYMILIGYVLLKVFILRRLSVSHRRSNFRILAFCSNKVAIVCLILPGLFLYFLFDFMFYDSFLTVNNRPREEMFPSDHLMVVAKVRFN